MTSVMNLQEHAYGLVTESQRHVHRLLNDYDRNLSLRRVPDSDPGFRPDQPYGVYEENQLAMRPWVFFLSDAQIDERVLSRIMQNDFTKHGANEKAAKLLAAEKASQLSKLRKEAEQQEERYEEMSSLARLMEHKPVVKHRIDGELYRIADEITPVGKHV
jgi:hypothetical protein